MAIERWGSLSVADHNDTTALTANVLLYDRLVMPIYTEAQDRKTQLAILIAHELNIPGIKEPEIALREAIGLSRETDFRKKREDLYDFQMTCLSRGMKPKAM